MGHPARALAAGHAEENPHSHPFVADGAGDLTRTSLDDLADRFLACTLPPADWTHLAHLRVGAWHVHHFGAILALSRLRDGIRRLNVAHGNTNTPTSGYHETITAAYVELIAAFLAAADPMQPVESHVEGLLAGPMADRGVLLRFWSREVLMSPQARAFWVPPDLAPLALPDDNDASPARPR